MRGGKLAVDLLHVAHGHPRGQGPTVGVQFAAGPRVVRVSRHQPRVRPGVPQRGGLQQAEDVAATETPLKTKHLAESTAGPDQVIALIQPHLLARPVPTGVTVGTGGAWPD